MLYAELNQQLHYPLRSNW